jgi:hypothetical protein
MVVRIANFFATPQMGNFPFKHYLINNIAGMYILFRREYHDRGT